MISWRKADLFDRFRSKKTETFPCSLLVVFPQNANGRNDSDDIRRYMGLLHLEISPKIPLDKYMKIRDRVERALAPYSALIDGSETDRRKFYSQIGEQIGEHEGDFQKRFVRLFTDRIKSISNVIVTDNYQSYIMNEAIDRITIRFSIEV